MKTFKPKKSELNEIAALEQNAIEFIGWYTDLPQNLDNDILAKALRECLDKVSNNQIEFPVAEFKDYSQIGYALGSLYGSFYVNELDWKWEYIKMADGFEAFAVVSPDKKYAMFPHHYMYDILTGSKNNTSLLGFNGAKAGNFPPPMAKGYVFLG